MAIPRSTAKTTSWAVRLWNFWAQVRIEDGVTPPPLEQISNEALNFWLSRFVIEVRNEQGEEYEEYQSSWDTTVHQRDALVFE